MNKLFTKIATLSVGLAMAIGVGVAFGGSNMATKASADESVGWAAADFAGQGTSSTGSEMELSTSGVTVTISAGYKNPNQSYAQSFANSSFTFSSDSYSITGFTITANGTSYNGSQSSGTMTATPSGGTLTKSTSSTTISYTGISASSVTLSHNKQIRFNSITVTYSSSSGSLTKLTTPSPAYNSSNDRVEWTADTNADHYEVSLNGGSTWSNATASSYHDVSGLTTPGYYVVSVKAVAPANSTTYSNSDSADASILLTDHDGSAASPYNVADAMAYIDSLGSGTGAGKYVSGIICQVDSYNSNYSSITYWISDDGTTTTKLEAYSGKGLSSADFSSVDDLQVGDEVTICGTLKKYNSTYEFDKNNYLTAFNRKTVSSIEISGDLDKDEYLTSDSWDPTGLTVTATYSDNSHADVTSQVEWSYSPLTPSAMGAGSGSLTITATFHEKTDSTSASVTVTTPSWTNTTNLSEGNYYIAYNDSGTKHYLSSVSSGKGATDTDKLNALVFTFTIVGDDEWEITNSTNYLGVGSGSTTLTLGSTQTSLTIDWEDESSGTRTLTGSSGRQICWYASDSELRTYSGKTDGTNGMTLEVAKTVSSFTVDSSSANKNVLKGSTFDAAAAAAAGFVAKLNYTDSTFDDVTSAATWTLNTSVVNANATLTVTYESYTAVEITGMNVYVVKITSLTINSSGAKTSGYWTGDTLDTTGLVITGHDSSSNNYSIAAEDCTFSPSTLTTAGNSITITATYTNEDESTATGTYTVSVAEFAYSKASSINGGDKVLFTNSGETKYMSGISNTSTVYGIATEYSGKPGTGHTYTVVAGASDGTVAFKGSDDKFLNWSSGNSLNTVSSVSANSSWSVSFDGAVATITNAADDTRIIKWNNDRFATYSNNSAVNVTIWKLNGASGQSAAETFATNFNKDIVTDICAVNDGSFGTDMAEGWAVYALEYDGLSSEAKAYIASKSANVSGDVVEKMLYEYKHIYDTYGASLELDNFIGRTETAKVSSSINIFPGIIGESNNATAMIIIISIVSLTAIGGYFFLRKKKER